MSMPALAASFLTAAAVSALPAQGPDKGVTTFPNASGASATFSTAGAIDGGNPFFQSLGSNGRSCASCHQPATGWSVTPQSIVQRFEDSAGLDPIFRTNDGANSPHADVSTPEARRKAYSMLLTKGLIRVGIGIPANAEFELAAVDDPYGYASASELSLFRRPLPSANLSFLSTVMWDGRETFADPQSPDCIKGTTKCYASIPFDLADQANGATTGHAQAVQDLTAEQRMAIVQFESGLFTAQVFDANAKDLTIAGALGGPRTLASIGSYFGINDVVSGDLGDDMLSGGPGIDTVAFRSSAPGVTVDLNQGEASGGPGFDHLTEFENILGGDGDDDLIGDAGPNVIDGGSGIDACSQTGDEYDTHCDDVGERSGARRISREHCATWRKHYRIIHTGAGP